MPTKDEMAGVLASMQEQIATLTGALAEAQKGASTRAKAEKVSTARYAYRDGGDTKLVLLANNRKRVMLSRAEADAIVAAHKGFDWSPGAPVYEKPQRG